ncbi:MAG: hypothetical protein ACREVK_00680 [Gammaproteobacteria bacterium]
MVADVYRPETTEKLPTVLVRIPFTKTWKNSLGADVIGISGRAAVMGRILLLKGYATKKGQQYKHGTTEDDP